MNSGPPTSLAINYGPGIKVSLSRRIGARLDLRRYRSDLKDVLTPRFSQAIPAIDVRPALDLQRFVCFDTPYTDRLRFTDLRAGVTVQFPRR